MKCTNCGNDVADGFAFCTSCGTPVPAPSAPADSDRTVLINQDMNNPLGQSGAPTPAAPAAPQGFAQPQAPATPQPNQFTPNPGQFTGQPAQNFTQAPQPNQFAPNPGQFTGQPAQGFTQAPQGFGQPMMGQQQQGYGQTMYGQQPNMMYNQRPAAPKAPRKPLSKGAKIGIIVGLIVAVLAVVFFTVIWPILTRSDLKGEYVCKGDSYYNTIVFDEGTYVVYDEDGDVEEVGCYTWDEEDGEIEMTSLEGYTNEAKFNRDDNEVKLYGSKYKSTNEDETLSCDFTEDYIDELESKVEDATEAVYDFDEGYNYYYLDNDDLADPYDDFTEDLAAELDYENDANLKFLMESGYIEIDISMYSDGEVDVYIWVW